MEEADPCGMTARKATARATARATATTRAIQKSFCAVQDYEILDERGKQKSEP
jgi:hypothetical protein